MLCIARLHISPVTYKYSLIVSLPFIQILQIALIFRSLMHVRIVFKM